MDKQLFICLANSYKYGGRCIAGIEIRLSADERSFRVECDDGEPRWIRPVQRGAEHEEIAEQTARNIKILDVIELDATERCGEDCQCENVYFNRMRIVKSLPFTEQIMQALLSKREDVLHTDERYLWHDEYRNNRGSLMLIEPEEPEIYSEIKENEDGKPVTKYKTRFMYKGKEYELPVTDPQYLARMEGFSREPLIGKFATGTFYFTISMAAEQMNGQHYKLLAGVIDRRQLEASDAAQTEDNESLPYYLAEQFAMHTSRVMFLTGKAGTGKTTFLKKLRETSPKTMAVVAPTGVAAINAGGMTIHSLFQLPVRTLVPTQQSYRQLFSEQRMTQRKRNMLYHLELLVIDEISMVRADVLDAIDAVLRRYKYHRDLPFGGVQVVMIGDLFQLSPVVTKGDDEEAMAKYYDGPYFFYAKVMQEVQPIYVELDHVFRQRDEMFVNLLNEVRENRQTEMGRRLLNTRYQPYFRNTDEDFHITLTTHNRLADNINEQQLERLPGEIQSFHAIIDGDFPLNIYPTEEKLELKIGARVMFIRNDDRKPRRYYNGKIGVITDFDEKGIKIKCDDGEIMTEKMEWKNIRYREDEATGKIIEDELGSFVQYPLRLAWAVTIHKSQGLTFDKVIIDAERAFAAGQVYVALSRCRTLEGIVLSSPLNHVTLANDPRVIRYTNDQPTVDAMHQALPQALKEYELQLFSALFDFRRLLSLTEQLRSQVQDAASFNDETMPFLQSLAGQYSEWQSVADKFRPQLSRLLLSGAKEQLKERVEAAVYYFLPLLGMAASQVANHPCRSKNKSDVSDFETLLSELFLTMHQKIHLMKALKSVDYPSADTLLEARNTFIAPMAELHAVMKKPPKKTKKSKPTAADQTLLDIKAAAKPQHAGERWMVEDDFRLYALFEQNMSINDIAKELSRTYSSIRARLKKFHLIQ